MIHAGGSTDSHDPARLDERSRPGNPSQTSFSNNLFEGNRGKFGGQRCGVHRCFDLRFHPVRRAVLKFLWNETKEPDAANESIDRFSSRRVRVSPSGTEDSCQVSTRINTIYMEVYPDFGEEQFQLFITLSKNFRSPALFPFRRRS